MFIGHFALGYAAKRWAPHLSLAVLFAAVLLADILWPLLVAAGIEHVRIVPGITQATPLEFISYPYSHSLLFLLGWGALFGWLCARRSSLPPGASRTRVILLVLLLVVSHWVLDVVTHVPDMPLYPGGPKFGFGLWNSLVGTMAVEAAMFTAGVAMYVQSTTPRDRIGRWGFVGLASFLLIGFVVNAASPPPPSVPALWVMALLLSALTISLAWWSDRHRVRR